MKKLLLSVVLIVCLTVILLGCTVTADSNFQRGGQMEIKVMTYNVRCCAMDACYNEDLNGINYIEKRIPRIINNIVEEMPDLIGFQEYTPVHNAQILDALRDEYECYVVYRDNAEFPYKLFVEGTPVFWKKSRFEMLDVGAFWFSDTPDVMSAFQYVDEESGETVTSKYNRVTTWVKLLDKKTEKTVVYFNTHLGLSEREQSFSIDLLRNRSLSLDCPVIITGDMNIPYDSKLALRLTEGIIDASKCDDNMRDNCTFQEYGNSSKRIDYVLAKGLNAIKHRVRNNDTSLYDCGYASDHFAVIATLVYE